MSYKKKLNILISSSIFPNKKEVTKGIYIFHQVKALSKYCNVKVVASVPYFPGWIKSKKYDFYPKLPKKEIIDGLEVLHPRVSVIPKFGRSVYGFLYALCLYQPMKRLKRSFQPDIIICYWAYPDGFANVLLANILKIPIILGGRGCDINDISDYRSKKLMVSWALKASDRVMAVSNAMKREMIKLGIPEEKIKVIPNGLDNIFKSLDKKDARRLINLQPENKEQKIILYCGRFGPEKGLEYLIKAVKILYDRNVSFRLILVGDGQQKDQIKKLVISSGLAKRVQFKEEMPYDKMPALMNSSDIFCLPSIREGWPNVVMEALGCGIPVVASEVGGVPEILTSPEYGIMVPKQNYEELANALMMAIKKPWNHNKIRSAVRNRTWDNVAQEIYSEINFVLGK